MALLMLVSYTIVDSLWPCTQARLEVTSISSLVDSERIKEVSWPLQI